MGWLHLLSEAFVPEVKEAVTTINKIPHQLLSAEQRVRGVRLVSFLKQCFAGYTKIEGIINHYASTEVEGEQHGFELIGRIHSQLFLQSRAEVLSFRDNVRSLKW